MNGYNEKLTLKEVVILFKNNINFLFSRWVLILLSGVAFGLLGILYAYISKPQYVAATSFVLSNGSKSSGLSGLASQFGLDLNAGENDAFSDENIISLMNSNKMMKKSLFGIPLGSNQPLINLFVKETALDLIWKKNPRTTNAFPFPNTPDALTNIQDSLVREVIETLLKTTLVVYKANDKQSIFIVKTTSTNEFFSVNFTNFLVDNTSKFYISTKTLTASKNLKLIQNEADSIRNILYSSIETTASEVDKTFNLNPTRQVAKTGFQKSQFNVSVFSTAYGEVLKNLEIAKITLQRETPLFQIIDQAESPLKRVKKSKLLCLIGGGILGGIGCIIALLFIKAYKHLMRQ